MRGPALFGAKYTLQSFNVAMYMRCSRGCMPFFARCIGRRCVNDSTGVG